MSYRLKLSEPLGDEVRRVAGEQLGNAVSGLRDDGADRVAAVHDARKSIKKTRALVRLARPVLPGEVRRTENAALRDAGRLLSGTRDADVLRATLDDLAEREVGRVSQGAVALAHEILDRRVQEGADADGAGDTRRPAEAAAEALETVAGRVEGWPLDGAGAADLREGAVEAYRRGRAALKAVRRDPSVEALHEWRKRVKDLWYHQRLLRRLWPPVLKAQAAETKRLSEDLGDDHDLAMLAAALGDDSEIGPLIAERRADLQAHALKLGTRIYAESPKAVRRRLERWGKAAGDGG
jgi:CHAD domain-containing protein